MSVVSRVEIAIKVGRGKLALNWEGRPVSDEFFWQEHIRRLQAGVLAIEAEHLFSLSSLPPLRRDPFDRILICQNRALNLPVATTDGIFRLYGIATVEPSE